MGIHNLDSRRLNEVLGDKLVDVTITSPPYYDLKDYGNKNQIGFGQSYEQYLNDLKLVFENVYKSTKDTGSLWVIIDVFRKNGEVTPLPFDFANKIKGIGWKLREIIVWEKDKTVPWTAKGQMRNLFEYILVFSKTSEYKFHIDQVKDFTSLKKWWIRYPERYNPNGKTPSAVWNFPIPSQGSWGNGYIRHFCPLPEDLIAQILKIATNENDIVLDPFAGSGAVLSKADNMNRRYIGFELNRNYITMFKKFLKKTGEQKKLEYEKNKSNSIEQDKFQKLILDLRTLKFAKVLFKNLEKKIENPVITIYVEKSSRKSEIKNKIRTVSYHILVNDKYNNDTSDLLNELASTPPLSKFGIEPQFTIYRENVQFIEKLKEKKLYIYTDKSTHVYKRKFSIDQLLSLRSNEIIISDIKLMIDEKRY